MRDVAYEILKTAQYTKYTRLIKGVNMILTNAECHAQSTKQLIKQSNILIESSCLMVVSGGRRD